MNFIRIIFWNLPSVKLDNSRTRSVIRTVFIFAFRIKRLDSSIPSCTPRFQPFAFIYLICGIRRIKKRKSTNTYIIISVCPVPFCAFSLGLDVQNNQSLLISAPFTLPKAVPSGRKKIGCCEVLINV